MADITPQDVQKFVSGPLAGRRNATTVMVDLKTLNAPFALAMRQGLVLSNPVPAAEAPRAEKKSRTVQLGAGRQAHQKRRRGVENGGLANAGIAPDVRKLLAGHSDDRSHAVYTHTQLDTLRVAVQKLPSIKP